MKKSLLLTCAFCAIAANASAFDFNPYVSAKAKYEKAGYKPRAHEISLGFRYKF